MNDYNRLMMAPTGSWARLKDDPDKYLLKIAGDTWFGPYSGDRLSAPIREIRYYPSWVRDNAVLVEETIAEHLLAIQHLTDRVEYEVDEIAPGESYISVSKYNGIINGPYVNAGSGTIQNWDKNLFSFFPVAPREPGPEPEVSEVVVNITVNVNGDDTVIPAGTFCITHDFDVTAATAQEIADILAEYAKDRDKWM